MAIPRIRYRFTVVDYHKMVEAGILCEDDRVELIDGEILQMTPIGPRHLGNVDGLTELFVLGLAGKAIARVQGSIRLNLRSEPQPDLVLLRRQEDFYASAMPGPGDVLLVIEVADSSLPYDRDVKMLLYARSGIPEAWLMDLNGESITVHREPGPDGYRNVFVVRGSDHLSPEAFPEFVLIAGAIFR